MGSLPMKAFPLFTTLVAILLTSPALRAQVKPTPTARTWVSGVGDDANPGSRTAPCKTFDGALKNTRPNGEISVLDPGSFGLLTEDDNSAVKIKQSVTISGDGTLASILAPQANGILINAADDTVVVLRSLSIEGVGGGLAGIKIVKAGAVHVENCTINGFETGISFESISPNAQLFVNNCRIHKCLKGGSASGILLAGSGGAVSKIEDTTVEGCDEGIVLKSGVATIKDSTAAGNSTQGFNCATGALMMIEGCVSSQNQVGIRAAGSAILSNTTVAANEANGLLTVGPGSIISYGNNRVSRNSPNGKPTNTVEQQ